jgi:aminoglycoside/choline kinase family phosphotransferase
MAVVRQRPQYLPYIPPTLAYVRPLMQRYTALQPLAALLHRYVPLWRE